MANQIAAFFATQLGDDHAERVAQHLRDFWEPRMRAELKALSASDADQLHPLVLRAVQILG